MRDHKTEGAGAGLSGECGGGMPGCRSGGMLGDGCGGSLVGGFGALSGRGGVGRKGMIFLFSVAQLFRRQRVMRRPVPTAQLVNQCCGQLPLRRAAPVVNTLAGCALTQRLWGDSDECPTQVTARELVAMSGSNQMRESEGDGADDTRLRYHLTSLYALRPIPDDLMTLVREIGKRLETTNAANDGD
jgi:hypothetical protein